MEPASPAPAPAGPDGPPLLAFLVPLGPGRYELYCEPQRTAGADADAPEAGWFGRLRQRFAIMLRAAEAGEDVAAGSTGLLARLQALMMAWVAERIAQQRLLWNLRKCDAAIVTHPDDMPFAQVMTTVHESLRADHRRHLIWLGIDTLLLTVSAVLVVVPGPNLVGYYFAFRVVGHWLSMRGAAQGRGRTSWSGRPSPSLSALRDIVTRPPHERTGAIEPIAQELGLPRLGIFVERMLRRPRV